VICICLFSCSDSAVYCGIYLCRICAS
jgi:hypothetical protein